MGRVVSKKNSPSREDLMAAFDHFAVVAEKFKEEFIEAMAGMREAAEKIAESMALMAENQAKALELQSNLYGVKIEAKPATTHINITGAHKVCGRFTGRREYGINPQSSDLCVGCHMPYILHKSEFVPANVPRCQFCASDRHPSDKCPTMYGKK
jgi:hypothetical protein